MLRVFFTRKFSGIRIWFPLYSWNVTHGNYQERLEREFNMTVITTVPNVSYLLLPKDPTPFIVNNPSDFRTVTLGPCRRAFYQGNIITNLILWVM
jgi:translation elongation factor EF-4